MRQTFLTLLINLLFSIVVGLIIGILYIVCFPAPDIKDQLIYCIILSIIIGTLCTLCGIITCRYFSHKALWGYLITFFVTLLGCIISTLPLNNNSAKTLIPIIMIAEPLALGVAYLNISYSQYLNQGLKRKQNLLKEKFK